MKIEVEVREVGCDETWKESYECEGDPEEYARGVIDYFNRTLRPGETPREFVSVEVVGESEKHVWEKQNMYTVIDKKNNHDIMKCKRCGITGKRYGLGEGGITRDHKYRAKRYAKCEGKV